MKVTYTPRHDGDPYKTKVKGIVFEANKPVEVTDKEILGWAPTNPWFKVEGLEQADPTDVWDRRKKPKTPEEYRRYATQWLKDTTPDSTAMDSDIENRRCAAEIRTRWKEEEDLRNMCRVGADDKELLAKIFDPRLAQLDPQSAKNEAS